MSRLTSWMDRRFYPNFEGRWDDKLFRDHILSRLTPESTVLDLGAGRGKKGEMNFKGVCRFIAGVDPDEIVLTNPYLDEGKVLKSPGYEIPYPDNTFDVIFSNSVIEHLTDPGRFFGEVYRTLKQGGVFLAKTPNKRHYVALFAQITPHWFHEFYNRLRGRKSRDTFPTTYACNRKRDIVRLAHLHKLEVITLNFIEGRPEYLRLSPVTYLCGLFYERVVNAFSILESFRCVIIIKLAKRADDESRQPRE